jgi:O-antigen ligase
MPPRKWEWGLQGAANAHNDPAQFLAEFGLVGFVALAAILLGLGGELLRSAGRAAKQGFSWRHDPLWVMGLAGLSITLAHSLIDLPFRCPAILYTWIVFAAVLTLETKNTMHKHSVT